MKRFHLAGMDPVQDSFSAQEEQEEGNLSAEQLLQLDAIEIGGSAVIGDQTYHRIADEAETTNDATDNPAATQQQ